MRAKVLPLGDAAVLHQHGDMHGSVPAEDRRARWGPTANLRTQILDFRGFDSSIILILRGGHLRFIGVVFLISRKS